MQDHRCHRSLSCYQHLSRRHDDQIGLGQRRQYRFTVPAGGQSVFLAMGQTCPTYLQWTLKNATTGATPASGYCFLGNKEIDNLPAGRLRAGVERDEQCVRPLFLPADARHRGHLRHHPAHLSL